MIVSSIIQDKELSIKMLPECKQVFRWLSQNSQIGSSSREGCVEELRGPKSSDPASSSSRVQKACGVDGINKNPPSFLKVILDCKTDRLQISPDFEKHLSDWSNAAVLKTKSGKTWNVKTCRTGKGLALVDGWQEFSRDLSLENGELLIFVYNGNMQFTVRIYRPNGLERLE